MMDSFAIASNKGLHFCSFFFPVVGHMTSQVPYTRKQGTGEKSMEARENEVCVLLFLVSFKLKAN